MDLEPERFREQDMATGLADLARELRADSFLSVNTEVSAEAVDTLSHEQTRALLHIAKEALANVRKHARATRIDITLSLDEDTRPPRDRRRRRGHGRCGERARARPRQRPGQHGPAGQAIGRHAGNRFRHRSGDAAGDSTEETRVDGFRLVNLIAVVPTFWDICHPYHGTNDPIFDGALASTL